LIDVGMNRALQTLILRVSTKKIKIAGWQSWFILNSVSFRWLFGSVTLI